MKDETKTLLLSEDGKCLDERSIPLLKRRRAEWVAMNVQTRCGVSARMLCPVVFAGQKLMADTVTGSLYEGNGMCRGGDRRIVSGAPTKGEATRRQPRGEKWKSCGIYAGVAA